MIINKSRIVVVASMPRTGTTFLYHTLPGHPLAFVPVQEVRGALYKETGYFTVNYGRGDGWYLSLYENMRSGQIGFDISAIYLTDRRAAERIKAFNEAAKVIMCLRDPAECAVSSYANVVFWMGDAPSFPHFLESCRLPLGDGMVHHEWAWKKVPDIVEDYRRTFGDNLLLYSFQLFRKDALRVMQAIESFSGLPPYFNDENFENVPINASGRGRTKLQSYLVSLDPLVQAFKKAIPYKLQVSLIRFFLKWNAGRSGSQDLEEKEERLFLARERLAEQCDYVRQLFEDSDMQLGSGRPFPS